MRSRHEPTYKIEQTEDFVQSLNEISKRYKRFKELHQSIVWHLERKPHSFFKIAKEFYVLNTEELENPDFPKAHVAYRIIEAEKKVIILDIEDD